MSENQADGRSKKTMERLKGLFRDPAQPGRLNPFSRHSCEGSRAPLPVPSRGKVDNASASAGANTQLTNSVQEDDMWKSAEAELRQDKKMNKLIDAYYEIMDAKLKNLNSVSTPERQKQISDFIESESQTLQDANKSGTFASVLKKAATYILKAEKIISSAAEPCLPASIACAGVMLVLSVSSPLLLWVRY